VAQKIKTLFQTQFRRDMKKTKTPAAERKTAGRQQMAAKERRAEVGDCGGQRKEKKKKGA